MRNPVVLALEWGTLDTISGGRTILGVGIGGGRPETIAKDCEVASFSKTQRGKVFEEGLEVLKTLWTQESVSFEGRFYQLRDVALGYKPVQKPHPPIWVAAGYYNPREAGTGPTGYHVPADAGKFRGPFERVARLADGWISEVQPPLSTGNVRLHQPDGATNVWAGPVHTPRLQLLDQCRPRRLGGLRRG